jgi:hypothetical protein
MKPFCGWPVDEAREKAVEVVGIATGRAAFWTEVYSFEFRLVWGGGSGRGSRFSVLGAV